MNNFHLLSAAFAASLLLHATFVNAQEIAAPATISPHCQKMMMIGCALTKNSKGRNAKAADKECADLLAQGECPPPVSAMPQKIMRLDDKETMPEDSRPLATDSKRNSYAPPAHIKALDKPDAEDTSVSKKADPVTSTIEDDKPLNDDVVIVAPKELLGKTQAEEIAAPAAATATSQTTVSPEPTSVMDNKVNESELEEPLSVPEKSPEILPEAAIKDPANPVKQLEPMNPSSPEAIANNVLVQTAPSDTSDVATTTLAKPNATIETSSVGAASILETTSIPMSLSFGTTVLIPDQPNKVTVFLRRTDNNSPVTFQDLKEVHTRKLHLLIIDPTLKEYHHVHPEEGSQAGEYVFTFTPSGSFFRVFADITIIGSDKNIFVPSVLGVKPVEKSRTDTVTRYESSDGVNVSAVLSFDSKPKSGSTSIGKLHLVDSTGSPIKNLEPVMGAFGHIVAFSQDLNHVLHVHPMGAEPTSAMDRGGPDLEFRFEPETSGFVRLFAQLRVGSKDIYVPFGFTVE